MKLPSPPGARLYRGTLARARLAGLPLACALVLTFGSPGWAADPPADTHETARPVATGKVAPPATSASAKDIGDQVRAALQGGNLSKKVLPLVVDGKDKKLVPGPVTARTPIAPAVAQQQINQQYLRARAIALPGHAPANGKKEAEAGHAVHWSYEEGEGGPPAWGRLQPEFATCANGKRQSPIDIEDNITLVGPAEPIQFNYQPSQGTVLDNGHTIQVDVTGDNSITVRDSTYKLLQFHFHHPAEERVNHKAFAMVAHLVHRNAEGQLAVVAVLLDPGLANSLINKVWTYMPLDAGDKVRMPAGLIDLNELLPKDQRYYQFMGSLTTPPCSEGVLWLVLKQPMSLSREQLKLFGQLFPNNARPVQPVNSRPVREAQ